MTFAALILPNVNLFLLIPGFTLLNWIFQPPYWEDIDFIMMIVTYATMFLMISWGVSLTYGVETI